MSATALRIASVLPDLLGTYGDSGNVRVLERRAAWREHPVEVVTVLVGQALPAEVDLYVLGGGEDDAQVTALSALRDSPLVRAVDSGAHVFGVCAGLQLLGEWFQGNDDVVHEGLGLIDAVTERLPRRVVGEVVGTFDSALGLPALTGFANHGGGTTLGPRAAALATTVQGGGNDGRVGGAEGAIQGRAVASYLHGPVLARNPALADWLLARVLGIALDPLPDGPPERLHRTLTRGW